MKRAELVNDIDELKGRRKSSELRQQDFTQSPADVYAVLWSAAGGFGDPLERDPAKVQADIDNGDVTEKAALEIYGVVPAMRAPPSAGAPSCARAGSTASRAK